MARPKVPLISKRAALEAALDIIDTEGIDALSIRRLAERLGVNGASLYHHFQNKEEIVVGAAKLALEEVRVPQGHEEPWEVWLLRNARRLRAAFRDHPDLVPVMLRREPLGIGTSQIDATFAMLAEEGVPIGAIAPMMEALELYAIGSALHEANAGATTPDSKRAPHMAQAESARALSPDEIFDLVCEQIVAATVKVATEKVAAGKATANPKATATPKQPAPKRSRAKTA